MKWFKRRKQDAEASTIPEKSIPHASALVSKEDSMNKQALSYLTPRERQVFELMMQGRKLNDISSMLGIKFSTVNTHNKSIYRKLRVNSRAECILRYSMYLVKEAGHDDLSS